MAEAPIPVLLVTGPLGSGKTTLVARLLDLARGLALRPALIVNEFGAVSVDGALLDRADLAGLREVTAGCLCCVGHDRLGAALTDLTRARPDVILVEASGLADPVGVVDAITAPDLLASVRLGAIIALLDATRPLLAGRGPAAAERQVGLADLVVINKVDRVGPAEVMACRRLMRRANPRARVVEAIQASVAVDVVEMLTRGRGEGPLPAGHPDAAHDHGPVHALVVPLPRPLDRDAFEAWLRALPPAVMRAKGFVRLAASAHLFAFQHVAGTWALGRVETRRPPATLAVLIGTALDEDGLRRGLAACAVPAPDLVGARAAEG